MEENEEEGEYDIRCCVCGEIIQKGQEYIAFIVQKEVYENNAIAVLSSTNLSTFHKECFTLTQSLIGKKED